MAALLVAWSVERPRDPPPPGPMASSTGPRSGRQQGGRPAHQGVRLLAVEGRGCLAIERRSRSPRRTALTLICSTCSPRASAFGAGGRREAPLHAGEVALKVMQKPPPLVALRPLLRDKRRWRPRARAHIHSACSRARGEGVEALPPNETRPRGAYSSTCAVQAVDSMTPRAAACPLPTAARLTSARAAERRFSAAGGATAAAAAAPTLVSLLTCSAARYFAVAVPLLLPRQGLRLEGRRRAARCNGAAVASRRRRAGVAGQGVGRGGGPPPPPELGVALRGARTARLRAG